MQLQFLKKDAIYPNGTKNSKQMRQSTKLKKADLQPNTLNIRLNGKNTT
jgi:hypothetical protein